MIKKLLFTIAIAVLASDVLAQTAMDLNMQNAELCNTLECTKKNMDAIDSQIVILLGRRLAFAKRVGELGGGVTIPAAAQTTVINEQFERIGKEARMVGYSPIAATSVFSMIIFQSNLITQRYYRR